MSHIKVGQPSFYLTEQFFSVFLLCYINESVNGSSFSIQMKATEQWLSCCARHQWGGDENRTFYVLLVVKIYRRKDFSKRFNITLSTPAEIKTLSDHFKHIFNIKLLIAIREQTAI